MDYLRADPDTINWEFALTDRDVPGDLPEQWATAIRAVTHDLHYLRLGASIVLDDVVWQLELNSSYWFSIGLRGAAGSPAETMVSFVVGRGYALDSSPAQCTVWVAETVQDNLAGYNFIQWPCSGGPLFTPTIIGTTATWVLPHSSIRIPIGSLVDSQVSGD